MFKTVTVFCLILLVIMIFAAFSDLKLWMSNRKYAFYIFNALIQNAQHNQGRLWLIV